MGFKGVRLNNCGNETRLSASKPGISALMFCSMSGRSSFSESVMQTGAWGAGIAPEGRGHVGDGLRAGRVQVRVRLRESRPSILSG